MLRRGGHHEPFACVRPEFRPPPMVRRHRGARRAGPGHRGVQLRPAVQLQLRLQHRASRAQGRHLHDPGQLRLRRRRPGAELHAGRVAAAHRHARRPDELRQGGRRPGDEDRARPRDLHPHADQRRQDLPLPYPQGDQVLQRPDAQAQRLRPDLRAAVHRARADLVLLGPRRREQVQHQELRPVPGRGRRRLGLHPDAQPDRARSRAHGPAGAAVRLRGAGQHLAEADRQQRAAGHRSVHVEVVQPEHPGRAGPQPLLPRVERRRRSRRATRTRSSRSTACRSPTRSGRYRTARPTRSSTATRSRPTSSAS